MTTMTLSVHRLRRVARKRERAIQAFLDHATLAHHAPLVGGHDSPWGVLPVWARGVRVESAGRFQHSVVLTSRRGH